jgi:rhodanese-related sulfurtransferase
MKRWLAFFTFFGSFFVHADKWQSIDAQKILNDNNVDHVIIDVRTAQEYDEGHIPRAINLSHNIIEKNIEDLLQYKSKEQVILYCRSGYRAGKAATILKEKGFNNLYHLEGDMLGWQSQGHPIEKN